MDESGGWPSRAQKSWVKESREQIHRGIWRISLKGTPGFASSGIRSVLRANQNSGLPGGYIQLRQNKGNRLRAWRSRSRTGKLREGTRCQSWGPARVTKGQGFRRKRDMRAGSVMPGWVSALPHFHLTVFLKLILILSRTRVSWAGFSLEEDDQVKLQIIPSRTVSSNFHRPCSIMYRNFSSKMF